MKEKLKKIFITFMLILVVGCTSIGSLNKKEYDVLIEFILSEKIVDYISNEDTIGAGEMEYITYTFDGEKIMNIIL